MRVGNHGEEEEDDTDVVVCGSSDSTLLMRVANCGIILEGFWP
jgi:hypothetical protein